MQPTYDDFLDSKKQISGFHGFAPTFLPDYLFDFQRHLVDWAIRKGRAAMFADCGLGKSVCQLVWAENIVRHTNKPVLILTPLSVAAQTVREATKFHIEAEVCRDGKLPSDARVIVTNYEKLHYFNPEDFSGVVCDESGILKNFDGKTRDSIVEFMRTRKYRLLCTATAAPNDYVELGNSAEALGEMGFQDMATRFFKKETQKDYLGWGRTSYRMRPHAERDFWRWVCSWARAVRRPSDLGFDDGKFILPELVTQQHIVGEDEAPPGYLFPVVAVTLEDQRAERKRTMIPRCEMVASLINAHDQPAIAWCHLNPEGNLIRKLIPGSVEVSGSDSDERKEQVFSDFVAGRIRVLVTKSSIAGLGLNFQHCAHQTFFPSYSFESYYQSVRRCWRFGQKRPVVVDVVTSEGESRVLASLQRKTAQADEMFAQLVALMNDGLKIDRTDYGGQEVKVPNWLRR